MAREKGGRKFRKENKEKKKKVVSLRKSDLQWLSKNTQFDHINIEEWHQVGLGKILKGLALAETQNTSPKEFGLL